MVCTEAIIIDKLLEYRANQSGDCLRDALTMLNASACKLDLDRLIREVESRGLTKEWEMIKHMLFMSKVNF
jgi:hypothetical protein